MTEEDEVFNDIKQQAKQRKEAVRAAINKDKPMNNPLAFPNPNRTDQTGMTLRDYFAAKAMLRTSVGSSYEQLAKNAYEIADAMMNAREE